MGITAFRWKTAAVSLNSQHKFCDNGASVVLRRLTAVSADLPAILEEYRRLSQKQFDPGGSAVPYGQGFFLHFSLENEYSLR